jgi:hypothetical protein
MLMTYQKQLNSQLFRCAKFFLQRVALYTVTTTSGVKLGQLVRDMAL